MKKQIIAGLAVISIIGNISAQQLPLYSQYYAVPFLMNPSLAGNTDYVNTSLIHKSMWKDMPGAPVTSAFTIEGPIKQKNIGLGAVLFSDVTDITQRTGFSTSYSYKIKINDDTKIIFGGSLGIIDTKIDFTRAIVKDANDPMLIAPAQHKTVFDAGFGTTFIWKALEVGIAIPQLLGNKVELNNGPSDAYYQMARQFMFSAKYKIDINVDKGLSVYPLVMLRYVQNTPLQYDVNAVLDWQKHGWLAFTYRSNYAIGINLGICINNTLRAGYAYDLAIGNIASYVGGSHEIMLGYRFGGPKEEKPVTDVGSDKERMKQDMMTDSMMIVLKKENQTNKDQIDQLKQQLDSVKKNTVNSGGGSNNSGQPKQEANNNKTASDSTGALRKAAAIDFKDEDGKEIIPNYFVIVGAFKSKDGAVARKADYMKRGFPMSSFIYNEKKQIYYVAVISTANMEAANRELTDAKYGTPDAWVFELK